MVSGSLNTGVTLARYQSHKSVDFAMCWARRRGGFQHLQKAGSTFTRSWPAAELQRSSDPLSNRPIKGLVYVHTRTDWLNPTLVLHARHPQHSNRISKTHGARPVLSDHASSWADDSSSSADGFKEGSSRTPTPESRPAHASLKEPTSGSYSKTISTSAATRDPGSGIWVGGTIQHMCDVCVCGSWKWAGDHCVELLLLLLCRTVSKHSTDASSFRR